MTKGEDDPVEPADAANEELQRFVYLVSHDLQAPVRSIQGYLGLLRSRLGEKLGEKGVSYVEKAVAGAQLLQRQIESLLEYSRVRTHGADFEDVDLAAAVARVMEALGRAYPAASSARIEDLAVAHGDPGQVERLLFHVLENAARHSEGASRPIEVSAARVEGLVRCVVKDHGSGFDSELAEKAFEPFSRMHAADVMTAGMGLAVARRIVERHGGSIRLETAPGKGTVVTFTLPAPKDDDP